MNTVEIFLISLMFVTCFMITEVIVSHFIYLGAFKRFIFRILFMVQYSVLIYFLFDVWDRAKEINDKHKENETES